MSTLAWLEEMANCYAYSEYERAEFVKAASALRSLEQENARLWEEAAKVAEMCCVTVTDANTDYGMIQIARTREEISAVLRSRSQTNKTDD